MLGGAGATVLGGSVDLAETTDTDGLAQVDGASDSGGTDVEPVNVLGRELLGRTGLDGVNPTCEVVSMIKLLLIMKTTVLCDRRNLWKNIPGMGSLP